MIFYFSGTGNSAWSARQLARLTGDEARDITTLTEIPDLQEAEQTGFVFPIYAWGVPEAVDAFAARLGKAHGFVFAVCTCGADAGRAMKRFSKRIPLDSSYSLVMPNNYIIGSDTDTEEDIRQKLDHARGELHKMAEEIRKRQPVCRVHEGKLAGVKSSLVNVGFNRFARSAKPFSVGEGCDGCGLCARRCPAGAISLTERKPVWKDRCFQCLGCINACPHEAIQYGKSTEGRRRYTIRPYLPQDEQF